MRNRSKISEIQQDGYVGCKLMRFMRCSITSKEETINMKQKQYAAGAQAGTGMPLISLPVGRKNTANVRRRVVEDLGNTSTARIISKCGLFRYASRLEPPPFLSSQQGAFYFSKNSLK